MKNNKCRVCGERLSVEPLLFYENMPKAAQHFPSKEEAAEERGVSLAVFQCEYCGLIQLTGEPVPYYRDVIRASAVSAEMKEFRVRQFKGFIEKYALTGKRIIEIGAGGGEYMELMQAAGAAVSGIENNPPADKTDIFRGFVDNENYIIPNAPYAAFYCMNFLEHVPNPAVFLRGIRKNLSDGAMGLVEVPNVDMILEKALFSEFIQDHLMYFTNKTLIRLLELNGFEVIACESVWHNYIISAIVQKRHKVDAVPFHRRRELITASVSGYIAKKRSEGKTVGVWGAGHQALAALTITGVAHEIVCVVDSAVFKQNKLTPGTHIPIVAPRELKERGIGAVLIMAAAYSDEIAGIMRRDYPDIDCAVLREEGVEIVK